jgi:hypothetical protein
MTDRENVAEVIDAYRGANSQWCEDRENCGDEKHCPACRTEAIRVATLRAKELGMVPFARGARTRLLDGALIEETGK